MIELPLIELLDKFGSGGHKPGSGSAAALQGLLSCRLLRTVISLTTEEKRWEQYGDAWPELERINEAISQNIEPVLVKAFQDDAVQFDRAIVARQERDKATNQKLRWKFERRALRKLIPATLTPFSIAESCLELATHAIRVFEIGFRAARGDSVVAIGAALSGATGALAIIHLNLTSFQGETQIKALLQRANKLQQQARQLQREHQACDERLKAEAEKTNAHFRLKIEKLRSPQFVGRPWTFEDIEHVVENIQNTLWDNYTEIWKGSEFQSPLEVLQPDAALVALGYQFEVRNFLGQEPSLDGVVYEVAGYIDKPNKYVAVSEQFSPEVILFTAAHELGHALLHNIKEAHRDRGLDGSSIPSREPIEVEADKFAACFLMPRKFVIDVFIDRFGSDLFVITEEAAFRLGGTTPNALKDKYTSLREFSRGLAQAESYNGRFFDSIASHFGVSTEAMAIRLEELALIEW